MCVHLCVFVCEFGRFAGARIREIRCPYMNIHHSRSYLPCNSLLRKVFLSFFLSLSFFFLSGRGRRRRPLLLLKITHTQTHIKVWCGDVPPPTPFIAIEGSGEGSTNHSPPVFFFFCGGGRRSAARAHQFHSVGREQSTMASRAETNVDERSLTSCV